MVTVEIICRVDEEIKALQTRVIVVNDVVTQEPTQLWIVITGLEVVQLRFLGTMLAMRTKIAAFKGFVCTFSLF